MSIEEYNLTSNTEKRPHVEDPGRTHRLAMLKELKTDFGEVSSEIEQQMRDGMGEITTNYDSENPTEIDSNLFFTEENILEQVEPLKPHSFSKTSLGETLGQRIDTQKSIIAIQKLKERVSRAQGEIDRRKQLQKIQEEKMAEIRSENLKEKKLEKERLEKIQEEIEERKRQKIISRKEFEQENLEREQKLLDQTLKYMLVTEGRNLDEIKSMIEVIFDESSQERYKTRQKIDKIIRDNLPKESNIIEELEETRKFYLMSQENREEYAREKLKAEMKKNQQTLFQKITSKIGIFLKK